MFKRELTTERRRQRYALGPVYITLEITASGSTSLADSSWTRHGGRTWSELQLTGGGVTLFKNYCRRKLFFFKL